MYVECIGEELEKLELELELELLELLELLEGGNFKHNGAPINGPASQRFCPFLTISILSLVSCWWYLLSSGTI